MVTKVGQRKFLKKAGYTDKEIDRLSPGAAHNIIGELNRQRREELERLKKEEQRKQRYESCFNLPDELYINGILYRRVD